MDGAERIQKSLMPEKAGAFLSARGYEAAAALGEGAFSKVVLIRKKKGEGAQDAPKLLACKISEKTDLAVREAKLLASIRHPLFPEFYGMWQEGGTVFLMMEYICGSSLKALLDRRGAFSEAQTVRAGLELADGLKYLHERPEPILYRDVKPDNILIRQDGRVRLLDLGCACEAGERQGRAGTPEFAAPEQFQSGHPVTFSCDVYGLGMTLRSMAGKNCGKKLKKVIDACVRERPEERISDMRSMMTSLTALEKRSTKVSRQWGNAFYPPVVCEKNVWESGHKRS